MIGSHNTAIQTVTTVTFKNHIRYGQTYLLLKIVDTSFQPAKFMSLWKQFIIE